MQGLPVGLPPGESQQQLVIRGRDLPPQARGEVGQIAAERGRHALTRDIEERGPLAPVGRELLLEVGREVRRQEVAVARALAGGHAQVAAQDPAGAVLDPVDHVARALVGAVLELDPLTLKICDPALGVAPARIVTPRDRLGEAALEAPRVGETDGAGPLDHLGVGRQRPR